MIRTKKERKKETNVKLLLVLLSSVISLIHVNTEKNGKTDFCEKKRKSACICLFWSMICKHMHIDNYRINRILLRRKKKEGQSLYFISMKKKKK